jgi:GNAT superfamily N-acetyltransferase
VVDPPIRVVPMRDDQLAQAMAVMVRAFFDDPLFVAGYPDPAERERVVPLVAAWNFRHGLLFGEILVAGDPPVGVTIAYRATPEIPAFGEERVAASLGDTRTRVGEAGFDRMQTPFVAADAQLMAALPGPHWYLDMVAVDPAHQGCGIGSALLGAVHERADADGWLTGLVTFQPRNLPLYARVGYEGVGVGPDPVSGLDYWCFRRPSLVRRT